MKLRCNFCKLLNRREKLKESQQSSLPAVVKFEPESRLDHKKKTKQAKYSITREFKLNKRTAQIKGVSNGPLKFSGAHKMCPLLDLVAKCRRVLTYPSSQNFRNCSHARILVKICWSARNFVNRAL